MAYELEPQRWGVATQASLPRDRPPDYTLPARAARSPPPPEAPSARAADTAPPAAGAAAAHGPGGAIEQPGSSGGAARGREAAAPRVRPRDDGTDAAGLAPDTGPRDAKRRRYRPRGQSPAGRALAPPAPPAPASEPAWDVLDPLLDAQRSFLRVLD